MPVVYYLLIKYNSRKVVLPKKTLAVVVGVTMPAAFMWISDFCGTSQGQTVRGSLVIFR